ncbi:GGDEF domain-containing protein [Trinickia terrae]|uniref:diguanylate cyclase n=1 Tax=Trinickia terrae TaxID=2571161 RepID=A0A4V5PJZ8_9BURK|nr:GGDEF domain-containing protein [Trinickia terrae]
MVIVCLSLVVLDGWRSWEARSFELGEMDVASSNLARAMTQQADDTFKEADTALVDIAERVRVDGTGEKALARLRSVMILRRQELAQLDGLFVYDEHGKWIASSTSTPLNKFNNADREYFIFHQNNPGLGPHIGIPVVSRSSGKRVIPVSRRIDKPDGSFGGVMLATIDIDFFSRFYNTLDIGKSGAVALVLNSGVMLVRRPFAVETVGKSMLGTALFYHYTSHGPVGTAFIKSAQDGVTRLNSYRNLPNFPVFVAAALSKDEILQDWWRDTIWHSTGVICLVAVVGLFGWNLVKQIELKARTEAELIKTRNSLEQLNLALGQLATQDGLTGLANRRQFDVALQNEYSRASRQASSLALIMMDVDYFKQYNDIYGHAAGDECLRAISRIVQEHAARRPGDLAARYGGEEIAVLLPGMAMDDAVALAGKIRQAVRDLEIRHTGSPTGFVTLSAGVDVRTPVHDAEEATSLLVAADTALYEAKKNGRNQVVATKSGLPSSAAF